MLYRPTFSGKRDGRKCLQRTSRGLWLLLQLLLNCCSIEHWDGRRIVRRCCVAAELMYVGLIVLLALVAACAVLGLVYCYIYHRHINPVARSSRPGHVTSGAGAAGGGGGGGGDDVTATSASNAVTASTHLMLFRKS